MKTAAPSVLRLSDGLALPAAVAVEALAILGTRGSGKSHTAAVLAEELWDIAVQFVVLDPTGVFWGLRSSSDGDGEGIPVVILGGPYGDAPLEPTAGALIADVLVDTGQSLVLDLSDFPSKAAQTRFATDLANRLYRRKARARTPLHIILDEAEEFIPQDVRGDGAAMVGAWETIVGLGRSRGLGATLISRRVQAVNKKVLDLIETLLAMRTGAPLARKRIEQWIEAKEVEDDAGVVSTLKELPTGTAWVWSPLRGELAEVEIRRIRTFDSYFTPEPGQEPPEARVLAPIDVAALGAAIAATVEQARENDPAAIRNLLQDATRRSTALEAEVVSLTTRLQQETTAHGETIAALGDAQTREVEPTVVKVVSHADLDAAWALVQGAKDAGDALVESINAAIKPLASAILEATEEAKRQKEAPPAGRAATTPEREPSRPAPSGGSVGTSAASRPATPTAAPPADGEPPITAPQQKILDALAWWERVGVHAPGPAQVGFVVGYHQRSKGYTNNLGALSGRGLIDRSPGAIKMTEAGRALAWFPPHQPTAADLQALIYQQVGGKRALMLQAIVRRGSDGVSVDELADEMGYHPRSKGFTNNLGTLSGLGLVDRRPGRVTASALCYL